MKKIALITLCILTSLLSCHVMAFTRSELLSPAGYWLTIDDKTHQPRGIVQLYIVKTKMGEQIQGKTVAGLYTPGAAWRKNCTGCIAPWTNKPLNGMTFMWQFQKSGTKWNSPWINGRIFDPDSNTKIYRSKLWLINGGKDLSLRGYIFLFYRTQTWNRLTKAQVDGYIAKMKKQIKKHPLN